MDRKVRRTCKRNLRELHRMTNINCRKDRSQSVVIVNPRKREAFTPAKFSILARSRGQSRTLSQTQACISRANPAPLRGVRSSRNGFLVITSEAIHRGVIVGERKSVSSVCENFIPAMSSWRRQPRPSASVLFSALHRVINSVKYRDFLQYELTSGHGHARG